MSSHIKIWKAALHVQESLKHARIPENVVNGLIIWMNRLTWFALDCLSGSGHIYDCPRMRSARCRQSARWGEETRNRKFCEFFYFYFLCHYIVWSIRNKWWWYNFLYFCMSYLEDTRIQLIRKWKQDYITKTMFIYINRTS